MLNEEEATKIKQQQLRERVHKHWMMNLGDDKAKIVIETIQKYKPNKMLILFCNSKQLEKLFQRM